KGGGILQGGTGRDILIAGQGGGTLIGNLGGDILIGGSTNYDNNLAALQAILSEWNSSASYAVRTAALASDFNNNTVRDNGIPNYLQGGAGQDWFFALLGGPNKDKLSGSPDGTLAGIL